MRIVNNLYILDLTGTKLNCYFEGKFRNDNWGNYFGLIQDILERGIWNDKIVDSFFFDFSSCEWIDPLPMLSFIIACKKHRSFLNYPIDIKLPKIEKNKISSDSNKVLKFLAQEGFLSNLISIVTTLYSDDFVITGNEQINDYCKLSTDLNYANSTLIKCQIIDLWRKNPDDSLDFIVSELIDIAKTNLLNKENPSIIDDLLIKVKTFVTETLQNVKLHAYNENNNLFAGLYIRFRYGFRNGTLGLEERKRLKINFRNESQSCPRLTEDYVELTNNFIEIFIIDNGIGIPATFNEARDRKYTFRESINKIMVQGERRNRTKNRNLSNKGGLNLIYNYFKNDGDYICGKSDNQWVGDIIPFNDEHTYTATLAHFDGYPETKGLAWIARLSVNADKFISDEYWKKWEHGLRNNPIYLAYFENAINAREVFKIKIIDLVADGKIIDKINKDNTQEKKSENSVIIFAPEYNVKNLIWNQINNAFQDVSNLGTHQTRTLIIADIPESENLIYISALENTKFILAAKWVEKITEIILVTKKFYVSILTRNYLPDVSTNKEFSRFTYRHNEELTLQYIEKGNKENFSITNSLQDLICFIRSYETIKFWEYISFNKSKNFFINGKIKWNNELKVINGYLNFTQVLIDPFLKKLLYNSLERCCGFFETKNCVFKPIDSLIEILTDDLNSRLSGSSHSNKNITYVGSVFATGFKEKDLLFSSKERDNHKNNVVKIQFLKHTDSVYNDPLATLLFWPTNEWFMMKGFKEEENYERIGRTHSIAKFGWKYFPIPRYDKNDKSFYFRTPIETYRDFQSIENQILSISNVVYQGNADLIKIDIRKALMQSFKFKGELAEFLVSQFFIALGGQNKIDFNEGYDNYYEEIPRELLNSDSENFYSDIGLIVYPNHLNTSIVIENIKKIVSSRLTDSIIPLDFIKGDNFGNSLLISPLTIDLIRKKLENSDKKGVLFFDCTIVSGRTRKQIKHVCLGLNASVVKSLFILDRNRMPYSLPNKNTFKSYWRLDLPRLRNNELNPINRALKEIEGINYLLVAKAKNRLSSWIDIWGQLPSHSSSSRQGIASTRLEEDEIRRKKFGIRNIQGEFTQIGGESNEIELLNSHGITLYVTEAHTITGRDDLSLKFCNDYNLSNSSKIELLATQLLLFEDEFPIEIHYKMIKELFVTLLNVSEENNHTALAAITLIVQEKFHWQLLREFSITVVENYQYVNIDLLIFFAYVLNASKTETLLEYTKFEAVLIRKKHDNLINVYKRLHFEIYQGRGKMHAQPILDLVKPVPKDTIKNVFAVMNTFSRLISFLNDDIKSWYLNINDINFKPVSFSSLLQVAYKVAEDYLEKNDNKEYSTLIEISNRQIIPGLQKIHDSIFVAIKKSGGYLADRPFNDLFNNLIDEVTSEKSRWNEEAISKKTPRFHNSIPKIKITTKYNDLPVVYKSYEAMWVVFDAVVKEEIKNFLFNSLYSPQEMGDFWDKTSDSKADMWAKIDYYSNGVGITLINYFDGDFITLQNVIEDKISSERTHLTNKLNCKIDVSTEKEEGQNIIFVKLTLPII